MFPCCELRLTAAWRSPGRRSEPPADLGGLGVAHGHHRTVEVPLVPPVAQGDEAKDAAWMAEKIVSLRIFEDDEGKMNLSLKRMMS